MEVSKIMRTKLILVKPDCPFTELLRKIAGPAPRQIYVVDEDNKLLGIVSAKDLLKEVMPSYLNADLARSITDETDFLQRQIAKIKDDSAKDIMTDKPVSLHPYHQLLEADALFAEHGFNTLPVLDQEGTLVGEITRMDIISQMLGNHPTGPEDRDIVDVSRV